MGILLLFIDTTYYYPHAILTQARIITMQQQNNNAPEPKDEVNHPNASFDSSCFPLTSFPHFPIHISFTYLFPFVYLSS
jgi:hypothetical protein